MIILFLLIIVANVINGEESNDTKFIDSLPVNVKKGLLDTVARRILQEVPEVDSGDAEGNGDVLASKLEEQSEFVKRILKEEVDSLKAKRRQASIFKNLRKSGNENDQVNRDQNIEISEKNETQSNEMDSKKSVSDKMDADAGHIDLTLRTARAKRGDTNPNERRYTQKGDSTEDKNKGNFVPVEVKLDYENNGRNLSRNTTEVVKEIKDSAEDIQIRNLKQYQKENIEVGTRKTRQIVTENPHDIEETTTQNNLNTETNLDSADTTLSASNEVKVIRPEDVKIITSDAVKNTTTIVEVSTTSGSIDTGSISNDSSGNETSKNYATIFEEDSTAADVKINLTETVNVPKNKRDHNFIYSSESFLENPVIDSKGRKNLKLIDIDGTTTQKLEEISTKSELNVNDTNLPVTEHLQSNLTEIPTLTTIEASYKTTRLINQPSTQNAIKMNKDSNKDLNKNSMHVGRIVKNSNEEAHQSKLQDVIETTTKNHNSSSHKTVVTSSTKARNDNKPCNQTSAKVNIETDCGNKQNKTVTEKLENKELKANQTQETVTESKDGINVTVGDIIKLGVKESLRDGGENKTLFDTLVHFGDMQVKKEYEVYEIDAGKPAFIEHKETDKGARGSIEQPQYAPVYNYDPENAYFNAYNRLGPNDDDSDDQSESELGNVREELRSKSLRMSKIINKHWGHKKKKIKDNHATTVPYYSKESGCESEEKKGFVMPGSDEKDHASQGHIKDNLSAVRQVYYSNKIFGYVPSKEESKTNLISKVKYLYNNNIGNSTEEILDEDKTIKKLLRTSDNVGYDERDDASEDIKDDINDDLVRKVRNNPKTDEKIEIVVMDIRSKEPSIKLRGGGYFDPKYKWDEDANTFEHRGKVYDLEDIVPYSTEKSHILYQLGESNKIVNKFNTFDKVENASKEDTTYLDAEDVQKTKDYLEKLRNDKRFYNDSSIDRMIKALEKLESNQTPKTPRYFKHLKQGIENLIKYSKIETPNDVKALRSGTYCTHLKFPYEKDRKFRGDTTTESSPKKYKAPNDMLNSIHKITEITPEIDMLKNLEPMLKINGLPITRSGDDVDLDLYVRILKDMVKMEYRALEKYDWLGTTVAIQSALAKLREIIEQQRNRQHIHPSDIQLFKYVEDLYGKAIEITHNKEDEALEDDLEELKYKEKKNNERMALPQTHKKIKNPWKIMLQISAMMNARVKRSNTDLTRRFELFLDCLQMCLNDFHTAIKEIARITKYSNQRWYKNIKELYLNAGEDKEYLEVLLHLYTMRLFGLIEESAKNGAEEDHVEYIKKNRVEVERAEVEILFIMRILKAIQNLKGK